MTIETIEGIMRLYNAARRNRDNGGERKELFAGRCEGIAMTLAKFGYRIMKQGGTYVALPKAGFAVLNATECVNKNLDRLIAIARGE